MLLCLQRSKTAKHVVFLIQKLDSEYPFFTLSFADLLRKMFGSPQFSPGVKIKLRWLYITKKILFSYRSLSDIFHLITFAANNILPKSSSSVVQKNSVRDMHKQGEGGL